MSKEYVERRDGGYYVAGTRVSLDSLVYAFLRGESAEAIQQAFPVLRLEEVYGGITYYLAHQSELDAYLVGQEGEFAKLKLDLKETAPLLYQKLQEARKNLKTRQT